LLEIRGRFRFESATSPSIKVAGPIDAIVECKGDHNPVNIIKICDCVLCHQAATIKHRQTDRPAGSDRVFSIRDGHSFKDKTPLKTRDTQKIKGRQKRWTTDKTKTEDKMSDKDKKKTKEKTEAKRRTQIKYRQLTKRGKSKEHTKIDRP
jgi:hypothetical protein